MLIVTGIIRVESEGELARVKAALIKSALKSRQDAGNIDYAFSVSVEDPCEIRLVEKWESEELLHAHLQIPDEEFNSAMAATKIESAVVVSNEASSETELLNR